MKIWITTAIVWTKQSLIWTDVHVSIMLAIIFFTEYVLDSPASHTATDDGRLSSNAELSTTLFDLARYASVLLTSNEELLTEFLAEYRKHGWHSIIATAGAEFSFAIITTTIGEMEVAAVGAAIGGPLTAIAIGAIGAAVCIGTVVVKIKKAKALRNKIQVLRESKFDPLTEMSIWLQPC